MDVEDGGAVATNVKFPPPSIPFGIDLNKFRPGDKSAAKAAFAIPKEKSCRLYQV